jgi:ABC-type phosphate transport system permease subunit
MPSREAEATRGRTMADVEASNMVFRLSTVVVGCPLSISAEVYLSEFQSMSHRPVNMR